MCPASVLVRQKVTPTRGDARRNTNTRVCMLACLHVCTHEDTHTHVHGKHANGEVEETLGMGFVEQLFACIV